MPHLLSPDIDIGEWGDRFLNGCSTSVRVSLRHNLANAYSNIDFYFGIFARFATILSNGVIPKPNQKLSRV